jgi:hypothetical protein
MTEYRWYFGFGKPDEWLRQRSWTSPTEFWDAFSEATGGMNTAYIYDEYDNLLYVVNNLGPIFKRLASTLRKKFKFELKYVTGEESQSFYDHLRHIRNYKRSKFDEAIELVEQAIVRKAQHLRRAT